MRIILQRNGNRKDKGEGEWGLIASTYPPGDRGKGSVMANNKGRHNPNESLCVRCIHAYGDDCFSTPQEERTWITKKIKKRKRGHGAGYIIYMIKECTRYEPGRKELDLFRPGHQFIRIREKKIVPRVRRGILHDD